MKISLGTDLRKKEKIPLQNYALKQNFGGDEIIVQAEKDEQELFKNIKEFYCSEHNKFLLKTALGFFVIPVSDEIKHKYIQYKPIILAVIDKKKKPIVIYEITQSMKEIKSDFPIMFV